VAQRDKHFGLKVFALAGAACVLMVIDVILLTLVVGPSAASTRTIPTVSTDATQGAALAFSLPTRDSRTPWPTRTPMRTATPWVTLPPTPASPPAMPLLAESTALPQNPLATLPGNTLALATPVSAESPALPRNTPASATPVPSVKTSSSALVTTPTPTLQAAALATLAPDTGGGPPTATLAPLETPVGAPTETPTGVPTETSVPIPGETPSPPPPSGSFDDLPDLETYERTYRNTIAGQPFDIESLTLDMTNSAIPRFVLEVAGGETKDVFAAQSAADVLGYGRGLLDDAKSYLGDEYCGIAVASSYETSNRDVCLNKPAWCQVGAYNQSTGAWTVTWTYVRGSYTGGPYAMEVWNAGP
jgi:hypothetical protein